MVYAVKRCHKSIDLLNFIYSILLKTQCWHLYFNSYITFITISCNILFVLLHSNVEGLPECLICPEGSYCNNKSINPVPCPKGYYCPNGSHDHNWKKCPPGTWNPQVSNLKLTVLLLKTCRKLILCTIKSHLSTNACCWELMQWTRSSQELVEAASGTAVALQSV